MCTSLRLMATAHNGLRLLISLSRSSPICSRLGFRAMSTSSGPLTSATLKHLREFWFHGQPKKLSVDEPVVKACMQRWYQGGKEVDDICR